MKDTISYLKGDLGTRDYAELHQLESLNLIVSCNNRALITLKKALKNNEIEIKIK